MRHRIQVFACLVVCLSIFTAPAQAQAEAPAPAPGRTPGDAFGNALGNVGFQRGVNLSHWFSQIFQDMDRQEHLRTHVTADDFRLIKSLGLDHVRIPVDPDVLQAEGYDGWAAYRGAVSTALKHGLNVIVDVHPKQGYKEALGVDAGARDKFVAFWIVLAGEFADTEPGRVRLEVLNEPMLPIEVWEPLQRRAFEAVRKVAPKHTVVLGGGKWSSVSELILLTPVEDANVIYNFHFYEPHQFTHQAATWGPEHWREMKGLPYPVSAKGIREALSKTDHPRAKGDITNYSDGGWNKPKIQAKIAEAAAWAQRHGGLTLTCNEFGVYTKAVVPEDRAAWLRDVREAMESHGVGWTMWDYAGGFYLVREGQPVEGVVEALGLTVSPR